MFFQGVTSLPLATFEKVNCRSPRRGGRRRESVPKIDLFSGEARGFESESITDTRTMDKNEPFLNKGFKHGKQWVDKNGQNAI